MRRTEFPYLGSGVGLRRSHYTHVLENLPPMDWFELKRYPRTSWSPEAARWRYSNEFVRITPSSCTACQCRWGQPMRSTPST